MLRLHRKCSYMGDEQDWICSQLLLCAEDLVQVLISSREYWLPLHQIVGFCFSEIQEHGSVVRQILENWVLDWISY